MFTDELAHAAGVDTVGFLRNIYANSKHPEQQDKVKRCRGVLDKAAEMAGWGKAEKRKSPGPEAQEATMVTY